MWLSDSHHFERLTVGTMTLLTATEYLCHKWQRRYSAFCNHISLFLFIHDLSPWFWL